MKIGNIVKPTRRSEFHLRSGAKYYPEAVVISVDPFILTSIEADMRWSTTIKANDFMVIGDAKTEVLNKCMKRLKQ